MKLKRVLISLGALVGTSVALAGCAGGLSTTQRQAKTQMMRYANGSGRDIISKNTFDGDNNTDYITFTKKEAKAMNTVNALRMQTEQRNAKVRAKAIKQLKTHEEQIAYINSEMRGLATSAHQAAVTSGDKTMKLHITNNKKKYPTLTLIQAQVQPNKKESKKQLQAITNKERKSEMNEFDHLEQKQRGKILKEIQKKGATKEQQDQVMSKADKQIKQQEQKEHNRLYK